MVKNFIEDLDKNFIEVLVPADVLRNSQDKNIKNKSINKVLIQMSSWASVSIILFKTSLQKCNI